MSADHRQGRVGEALPASSEGYDRLVVLDGPQQAWDDARSPHFPALLRLMRDFDAAGKPVAGLCLGCLLLARAHGASVRAMSKPESGYGQLVLTASGARDPVLGRAGAIPPLMEVQADTFDLPGGAELLVTGAACANQCFRVGNASYGFRFHLELDFLDAKFRFADEVLAGSHGRFPLFIAQSMDFCRNVAGNWLKL